MYLELLCNWGESKPIHPNSSGFLGSLNQNKALKGKEKKKPNKVYENQER